MSRVALAALRSVVRWLASPAPRGAAADQILVWIALMMVLVAAVTGGAQ